MQPQQATFPLQFIQADLFKTGINSDGLNYICVFEDRYTKFCKLYALKDTKAKGVAKCVESFIATLGCPDVWGTDGGPEFYNVLVMAICHVFSIKKEFALSFRPMTQGQTERKNRTIKAELIKRIHQFGPKWPTFLKWIEMAYNCTPHPSHGYTPFLLMFGREARVPMQATIPKIDTSGWQTTMKSYLADFLDRMAKFQKQARVNHALYQLKMAQQHDQKLLPPLQPGAQVLRDVPAKFRGKLDIPRDGPWTVEEQRVKEGKVLPVYKIRNEGDKVILTHRENLSPFAEPNFVVEKPNPTTRLDDQADQLPTPKQSKKSKVREVTSDGPASRTRSRKKPILSLCGTAAQDRPQVPVVGNGPESEEESVRESSDDDGSDGDGDGGDDDGGEDDDDDDNGNDRAGSDDDQEGEDDIRGACAPAEVEEPVMVSGSNSAEQFPPANSPDNISGESEDAYGSVQMSEESEALSQYQTPESHETTPDNSFKRVLGISLISKSTIEAEMSKSAGRIAGPAEVVSPEWDNFLPLNPSPTSSPGDLMGAFFPLDVTASSPSDETTNTKSNEIPAQPNLSTIHEISADNSGRVTEVVSMEGSFVTRRTHRATKPVERYGH